MLNARGGNKGISARYLDTMMAAAIRDFSRQNVRAAVFGGKRNRRQESCQALEVALPLESCQEFLKNDPHQEQTVPALHMRRKAWTYGSASLTGLRRRTADQTDVSTMRFTAAAILLVIPVFPELESSYRL